MAASGASSSMITVFFLPDEEAAALALGFAWALTTFSFAMSQAQSSHKERIRGNNTRMANASRAHMIQYPKAWRTRNCEACLRGACLLASPHTDLAMC